MNIRLEDLFKLSPAERMQLAVDLWDSVADDPDNLPPLSEEELAEIERRLAELERDPSIGQPWSEVRALLWSRVR